MILVWSICSLLWWNLCVGTNFNERFHCNHASQQLNGVSLNKIEMYSRRILAANLRNTYSNACVRERVFCGINFGEERTRAASRCTRACIKYASTTDGSNNLRNQGLFTQDPLTGSQEHLYGFEPVQDHSKVRHKWMEIEDDHTLVQSFI